MSEKKTPEQVMAVHVPYDWCGGMWECTAPDCDVDTSEHELPARSFARHVLDALRANGIELIQVPEPQETSPGSDDENGYSAWATELGSVLSFDDGEIHFNGSAQSPADLRDTASALLAAARATEVS